MAKSTMGAETVAAESAKKDVCISRYSTEVMSLQKAMDNFRKLLSKHDVENERVHIYYYAKLSSTYKLQFTFFRPNSEAYDFTAYIAVSLLEKQWKGGWEHTSVWSSVKDNLDFNELAENFKEKFNFEFGEDDCASTKKLMAAIA